MIKAPRRERKRRTTRRERRLREVRAVRWEGSFLGAVQADFARHGVNVIARIREEKPEAYLKLVASVLPKDLSAATGGVDDLSDEQIIDRIRALDAAIRPLLSLRKRAGGLRKRVPPAKR